MSGNGAASFERFAAERLLGERASIARGWARRISGELRVRPRRELPGEALEASLPEVLRWVAESLRGGGERPLTADASVVEALRALAERRHREGHDVQEVLRELHLLAEELNAACARWTAAFPGAPVEAVLRVAGRLDRAPMQMGEIIAGVFMDRERAERGQLAEQLGAFAEMLVHELRTPLNAAETAAILLESDELIPGVQERRRFAGLVQRNLQRASAVIGDVRGLALPAEASRRDGRRLPACKVLAEVLAEVEALAAREGVRVEVEEPLPEVEVDASRLELVLLNLIGNAVKYSDPSQPARWVRVRFERGASEGEWAVEVSDNGIGIPEELHGRVFERAFRADPERADGTGIGLAIVREAVRQLGGRIHFRSQPGVGTTFRVSLPAEEAQHA